MAQNGGALEELFHSGFGSIELLWGYPRGTRQLAIRRVSLTAMPRRSAHAGSDSFERFAATAP